MFSRLCAKGYYFGKPQSSVHDVILITMGIPQMSEGGCPRVEKSTYHCQLVSSIATGVLFENEGKRNSDRLKYAFLIFKW